MSIKRLTAASYFLCNCMCAHDRLKKKKKKTIKNNHVRRVRKTIRGLTTATNET